jgi:hypothetical protein
VRNLLCGLEVQLDINSTNTEVSFTKEDFYLDKMASSKKPGTRKKPTSTKRKKITTITSTKRPKPKK